MRAATMMRFVVVTGLLGMTGGCDLVLGIPNLGDPGNVASMTARFKATIQAEARSPASLDWGVADDHIWQRPMGPRVVAFCGRPVNAPVTQRPYQINFFRGSFGAIDELVVDTPAYPAGNPPDNSCATRPTGL